MDIRLVVFDVDGTLTDGKIYMSPSGELMKAFNIKDGCGITLLRNKGITPVIITARKSDIVTRRCEELKITHIYQGVENKVEKLKSLCEELGVSLSQCAYIGDDLYDLECMKICGFTGAPADAVKEIKKIANFQCSLNGGEGAVREFCDYILEHNT